MGFSVDRAEDGIFCVDELEKAPDGTYDRMLVDIQMPNMDGYKAARSSATPGRRKRVSPSSP